MNMILTTKHCCPQQMCGSEQLRSCSNDGTAADRTHTCNAADTALPACLPTCSFAHAALITGYDNANFTW
jgi:hypothetical protein